jgi:hypothetical protein
MAYKYSVGERKFGDIKASSDAQGDTLINFDEDCIILETGGEERLKISGSSGHITFNDSFTFPITDGNTNQVLTTDGQGNLSFQAPITGSGGNPPGGSNRQVQFNDDGSFAGNPGITVDNDFNLLVSGSIVSDDGIGVGMGHGGGRNQSDQWVSLNSPEHTFHVVGDINDAATFSVDTAADSVGGSYWTFTKARGTPSSPTGVNTDDEVGRIQFFAHTGTSTLKRSALIVAQADSDGDGRLKFYVTKEGDVDNVAIECYNNQVTVQDQMVIGSSGIIPISNGGASIGGSSNRFDYMRANNLVAYESLQLGGTHPLFDKGGFGISINKDHIPIGNYTSGEGLGYISNSTAVENVIFALHKTGSHFGGIAINGSDQNNDEKVVFFSENSTSGFEWRNAIPDYGTNGMGNLSNTGTVLMGLNSDGTLTLGDITFPKTDGTNGQVLKTDGSGSLTWQDESGGSSSDIENGTWTPGLENGYVLQGTAYGKYQRVGNQVTVWFKFNVGQANDTATQEMKITGLPYEASGTGIWSTGPQPQGLSFACSTLIENGDSVIRFKDQTLTSAKQISNFANEGAVRGNITYWIG